MTVLYQGIRNMNKGIRILANTVSSVVTVALFTTLLASCGAADSGIRPFKIFGIEDSFPTSMAFSPDGKILASGARIYNGTSTWTGAIHLWRSDDWSALSTLTLGEGTGDGGIGIAFSPDGPNAKQNLLAAVEPR